MHALCSHFFLKCHQFFIVFFKSNFSDKPAGGSHNKAHTTWGRILSLWQLKKELLDTNPPLQTLFMLYIFWHSDQLIIAANWHLTMSMIFAALFVTAVKLFQIYRPFPQAGGVCSPTSCSSTLISVLANKGVLNKTPRRCKVTWFWGIRF